LEQVQLRLDPGKWYSWIVSVDGRMIRVSIDGVDRSECQMTRMGRIVAATLVSKGANSAEYDDVRVTIPLEWR